MVGWGEKASHTCTRAEGSFSDPETIQDSVQKSVLIAKDNSIVVAYINKQGGIHSVVMCGLQWRTMIFSATVAR